MMKLLLKGYIKLYHEFMSQRKYDRATFLAYKKQLGDDKVAEAARKWYDQLLESRSTNVACAVAIKFNLPPDYLRYAIAEELRLKANDVEEAAYKFMQDAIELRAQAKEIEQGSALNDASKDGFRFEKDDVHALHSTGERFIAEAIESGSFFKDMKSGKRFGLEEDVFYRIGLAIFENELILGNKKHADLIAKSYKISDEDKRIAIESVKSRESNNRSNGA